MRGQSDAVDLLGDGKHDRQAATIVVDPWPNEAMPVAPHTKRRAAREYRIEVRADDDGRQRAPPRSSSNDIAGVVDLHVVEP